MTEDEMELMVEAIGRANAALNLSRLLIQMLGERGIIAPAALLEALDMGALAVEEHLSDPRATPDLLVQLRETQSIAEVLRDLSSFQKPETP